MSGHIEIVSVYSQQCLLSGGCQVVPEVQGRSYQRYSINFARNTSARLSSGSAEHLSPQLSEQTSSSGTTQQYHHAPFIP